MTVTYPHDRPPLLHPPIEGTREEPFVPVYARNHRGVRGRKGGVKTWMILAPVGVLVLAAAAAALVMGDRDAVAPPPLAEPAATAPVLPAQPLPAELAAVEAAPVIEATPSPAPVVRRTVSAPPRRAAATVRATTPAPRVVVPAEPASPQPYTATLNTAPAPAQNPAPVIVIQPAG